MKVDEIMTRNPNSCLATDSLARVGGIMWESDCGVVPVVSKDQLLIGIITDRDIAIAVTSQTRPAYEIQVSDTISRRPVACLKSDSIKQVLKKMRKHKVRRLPVTNGKGKLIGIVSLADIVRAKKRSSLKKQLLKTIETINEPRRISLKEV